MIYRGFWIEKPGEMYQPMSFDFEENIHLTPAILSLNALLPEGLDSLAPSVFRALQRDDYSAALAAANGAYSDKGPESLIDVLTYVILLIGRDLVDEAMGIMSKALKYHEHDISLQLAQTEALIVQGNYDAARALMEGMRTVSHLELRHLSFLGDMYLDLGEEDQAIECYEKAIEQGSQSVELAFRLGHIYLEREDFDKAIEYIEMAARLDPQNAVLWEASADIFLQIGEFERAIYAYKRVLKQDPDNARTWLYLGIAYQEFEDYEQAESIYEKVVKMEPDNLFGWLQLGHTQLMNGYPDKALQSYGNILRQEPDNIDAIHSSVEAAYELGDIELAGKFALQAVEQQPDSPESNYNWGVILQALYRPQEAEAPLLVALNSDPNDARYVSAWALNLVLLDKIEEGKAETLRAALLDADAESLLAVAEELIKRGQFDHVLTLLKDISSGEPTWHVVAPVMEYLACAFKKTDINFEDLVERFLEFVKDYPETIPVMWDFEEFDRIALVLPEAKQTTYKLMVGVLEGRKDAEKIAVADFFAAPKSSVKKKKPANKSKSSEK